MERLLVIVRELAPQRSLLWGSCAVSLLGSRGGAWRLAVAGGDGELGNASAAARTHLHLKRLGGS